jgi:hypothetical protein
MRHCGHSVWGDGNDFHCNEGLAQWRLAGWRAVNEEN